MLNLLSHVVATFDGVEIADCCNGVSQCDSLADSWFCCRGQSSLVFTQSPVGNVSINAKNEPSSAVKNTPVSCRVLLRSLLRLTPKRFSLSPNLLTFFRLLSSLPMLCSFPQVPQ